jgi:primosomal protein N' (replication factor Y)
MPSALLESETVISQKTDVFVDETLSDDEFLIFQALQQQSSLKVQDIILKKIFSSHSKLIDKIYWYLRKKCGNL